MDIDLIFEDFNSDEFPFSFEILEYADGRATVAATPRILGLDVNSIEIVSNDDFLSDEGRAVAIQDGVFTLNVNTFYAFSASALVDDIRTHYYCSIILFLSDVGQTHYLTVHVRDISESEGHEETAFMPFSQQVHQWRMYTIITEITFRQNGWTGRVENSVAANTTNTGWTNVRLDLGLGFITQGSFITISRTQNPNVFVYTGSNMNVSEWNIRPVGTGTIRTTQTNSAAQQMRQLAGTFVGTTTSTNRNAFPNNGPGPNNRWYVFNGTTTVNVPVTGVSISPTSATISPHTSRQFTATVSPNNATNRNVTWRSSNTSVAEVSTNGIVIGRSPGTATITVRTNDGGREASALVTVPAPITTHTLTYSGNSNTGGAAPQSQIFTANQNFTLQSNTGNLSRTNFAFAGWNTAANGTGTNFAAGGQASFPAGNRTLFARWQPNPIIRYPAADGNEVVRQNLRVEWDHVANAAYNVSLRNLTTNELLINGITVNATNHTINQNLLVAGHQYRLSVSATVPGLTTSWSERIFRVTGTTTTAPTITNNTPTDQTTTTGQNVTFSVTTTGNPAPSFQWQILTPNATQWANLAGQTGSTLTLSSVQPVMNGNRYRVRVSNAVGVVYSRGALLTVNPPARVPTSVVIEHPSYNLEIPNSGSRTLTIRANVLDQFGAVMTHLNPTEFIITPPIPNGVSINSSTGVLTVNSTAQPGTVSVRAVYSVGNISISSLSVPVNLVREVPVGPPVVNVDVHLYGRDSELFTRYLLDSRAAAESFMATFNINMRMIGPVWVDTPTHMFCDRMADHQCVEHHRVSELENFIVAQGGNSRGLHSLKVIRRIVQDPQPQFGASAIVSCHGSQVLGGAYPVGTVGNYSYSTGIETFFQGQIWLPHRIYQHEWSHNYGARHCSGICIMNNNHTDSFWFIPDVWCNTCRNTIMSNRTKH